MNQPDPNAALREAPKGTDKWGYLRDWSWPDLGSHLLFDIGYSYAMLREAEGMFLALTKALESHETSEPESAAYEANKELRWQLEQRIDKLENFRKHRLNIRDDLYAAGYEVAAKLEKSKSDDMS